jgi:hypothetical protein
MSKNQNETDTQRQRRERDEAKAGSYESKLSNDEYALTRKEIMEARDRTEKK